MKTKEFVIKWGQGRVRIVVFFIMLAAFIEPAFAQQLDSLRNWRLHKMMNTDALLVPEDSLRTIPSRVLPKVFLEELEHLRIIETDEPFALMTAYLLSYEDPKGKMVKVIACGAGNYIYIDRFQKYWRIPQENRETWLAILREERKQIP